jgi:hypothetical protein
MSSAPLDLNDVSASVDATDHTLTLPDLGVPFHAKSKEETYVTIVGRNGANAKYICPRCGHHFTGGNQKIRVHITGAKEGGSSVKACTNPDPESVSFCSLPRNPYKKRQKVRNTYSITFPVQLQLNYL